MTLSNVLKQSLRSIGEYIIGFVVFLAAFLTVLNYLGFTFSLAETYNNLDPNGKITFILAINIILCSIFFTITIYVINRLVKEIDENKRIIIKSKQ